MADQNEPVKKGGYGKRPLWQWVLIYVVVGGIVYFAVYYFFFKGKGGYQYNYPGAINLQQRL
jgi:hypothetical protein